MLFELGVQEVVVIVIIIVIALGIWLRKKR
jgi:hypothetical protein